MLTIKRYIHKEPVYDITVKGTHNFYANGILVHNCTEIFLHTKSPKYENGKKVQLGETAVCNLASLCLPSFFKDGALDTELLQSSIAKVIRGLDNVVSLGFFPTKEAKVGNDRHRAIGMGTMGWANVFAMLGIAQDSDEAIYFTDALMEQISYYAIDADCELAKERGVYPSYEGSKWSQGIFPIDTWQELATFKNGSNLDHPALASKGNLDWAALREKVKQYGMRNSNVMAVAPNASIAYQLGCEQSHEPFFSMVFRYENKSGNYYIINRNFIEDMKREGLWSEAFAKALENADGDVSTLPIPDKYKAIYKTAFARDQIMLVKGCAARQKWIDQGLSFNLYNGSTSLKYLHDIYMAANKFGLKSTYYLRNQAATSIQKTSGGTPANEPTTEEVAEFTAKLQAAKQAAMSGESCEMCQG